MADHVTILYRSIARDPDLERSDLEILRTAIAFNRRAGITGFLWRGDGQFFQALQGPVAVTDALMSRIARDERHRAVEIALREEGPPTEAFSGWSMGYDHFLERDLGLELQADGSRPPMDFARARATLSAMARAADEVRAYGSAFPFTRQPGETEELYLERLSAA